MATNPVLITLHIQLEPLQLDPPIWRRIRVSGDCTLRKLHHFIQATDSEPGPSWVSIRKYAACRHHVDLAPPLNLVQGGSSSAKSSVDCGY